MRIEKAQEYGAAWAREWSTEVTHVITDKHLHLSDVKKAIGSDQLKGRFLAFGSSFGFEVY